MSAESSGKRTLSHEHVRLDKTVEAADESHPDASLKTLEISGILLFAKENNAKRLGSGGKSNQMGWAGPRMGDFSVASHTISPNCIAASSARSNNGCNLLARVLRARKRAVARYASWRAANSFRSPQSSAQPPPIVPAGGESISERLVTCSPG